MSQCRCTVWQSTALLHIHCAAQAASACKGVSHVNGSLFAVQHWQCAAECPACSLNLSLLLLCLPVGICSDTAVRILRKLHPRSASLLRSRCSAASSPGSLA
eukprot:GHRR01029581.1.p2 GENE.GHRR01029581.1~~GHRR01029581.1.p2  ORF type:complete len:102 (+),score=24.56 GHRR01029581.1:665-970(+)